MGDITRTSIMIKPASADCNLRCEYCYYYRNSSIYGEGGAHRMTLETLEKIIREYLALPGSHKPVSWQGGEPTLAGLDFFRKAVEYQRKYARPGQVIENNLQTNGLVLNEDWAEFLADERFLVGISLDGPEQVHDCYRRDDAGKGTYAKVMRAIELMNGRGTDFNILAVVAKHTIDKPEELYHFFRKQDFDYIQFIPCAEKEDGGYADFSIDPAKFGDFLCRVFDAYLEEDNPQVYERTIDSVLHSFLRVEPPFCVFGDQCDNMLTFEHNGDVFPCDFFVNECWKLGNINSDGLSSMIGGNRLKQFGAAAVKIPDQCGRCRWNFTCKGGCARYRRMESGDFSAKNYFCESWRMFFDHSFGKLNTLMKNYPANRSRIAAVLHEKRRELSQLHQPVQPAKKTGRNEPCPCGSSKKYKKCCGTCV